MPEPAAAAPAPPGVVVTLGPAPAAPAPAPAPAAARPRLLQAGSTFLRLAWAPAAAAEGAAAAPEAVEAEFRRSAWFVSSSWTSGPVQAEDTEITGCAAHVTVRGLEPMTSYDVRLIVVAAGGARHTSAPSTFSTLPLAPPLKDPPTVQCARHDRLLLKWKGPSSQDAEVVAYRVRYYDCEPRWPVVHEVEAKLPPRLFSPTEQTMHFLQGKLAMRVHPAVAAGDDSCETRIEERSEVHFWLLDLAPSKMYYVQVAALTAAGQGQWSDKSRPLYTWRPAPEIEAPRPLLVTQASIALAASLHAAEEGAEGQDEEVADFELQVRRCDAAAAAAAAAAAPRLRTESSAAEAAGALAARWQAAAEGRGEEDGRSPAYVLTMTGLAPRCDYECSARAMTRAGAGAWSSPVKIRTLPVPPEVCDLLVEKADHCSARLTWRIRREKEPSEPLLRACIGDIAEEELAARRLKGFQLRMTEAQRPSAWESLPSLRVVNQEQEVLTFSTELKGLQARAAYLVQVAAVAQGYGRQEASPEVDEDGDWVGSVTVQTESLAPELQGVELVTVGRQSVTLRWPTPTDIPAAAPVLSYVAYICKKRDRGRPGSGREVEMPLDVVTRRSSSSSCATNDGEGSGTAWLEGTTSQVLLGRLEPNTGYVVQVAAQTCRGLGQQSAERCFTTRPSAPRMEPDGPRLLRSYHNRLLLACNGPVPDWPSDEVSDIVAYRARYYECARLGPNGAWVQCDVDYVSQEGSIQFWLVGLQPERQYVVQVAAVTPAGQGPWSEQSDRLRTWRLAPSLSAPKVLFRTHSTFVVGWEEEPLPGGPGPGLDEEILEFVVRANPAAPSKAAPRVVRPGRDQAVDLADVWQEASADIVECIKPEEAFEASAISASASLGGEENARLNHIVRTASAHWPDAMLCSGSAMAFVPTYAVLIDDLAPATPYTCSVCAISAAGEGRPSALSTEINSLAVAPRVEDTQVDDVQHDQFRISWELPRPPEPLLAPGSFERLGLTASLEEMEVQRYAVRCAAWRNWSRLSWREPVHTEEGSLPLGTSGRVDFAVLALEPESDYVIEVRAESSRGPGEWCRVGDKIRTAMVAPAPPSPELVYATSRSLTFSFSGVEDSRVAAYEVRRFEGWAGGWARASEPLRFDARSLAVRISELERWVVNIVNLRSETCYALQLRGVTRDGCVTKWSAYSEPMWTQPTNGEETPSGVADVGIGVNDGTTPALTPSAGAAVSSGAVRFSADGNTMESVDDFAKKLEAVLSFTMDYATAGVRLPHMRIASTAEQAEELLQEHRGCRDAAVAAACRLEDEGSWRTKLPDFLIQQVPVVGCSTLLLRELWRNIRRCALIAHLYGQDPTTAENRALVLLCLMPVGGGAAQAPTAPVSGTTARGDTSTPATQLGVVGVDDVASNGRKIALLVSRALARETFVRATGLKSAGQVVDLLGVAGQLFKLYGNASPEGASQAPGEGGKDRADRNAATAQGGGSAASTSGGLPAGEDLGASPSPARIALFLFKTQSFEERPAVILALFALWLLPVMASITRFVGARLLPLLARRVQIQMELPLAGIVTVLLVAQVATVVLVVWLRRNLAALANIPATLVFVVYAGIPATSVFLAVRAVLQSAADAPFFIFLGCYNLASGYLRWSADLEDDARLERRQVPRVVQGRQAVTLMRRGLWVLLLLDFAIEELLGRVAGLHPFRVLGPPPHSDGSLAEYRTFAFASGLVGAAAQERLLEVLQRRAVLLRLLGARKALHAGLTLLLMGAYAVVQQQKTVGFLSEVSPTPWWCCMVLWIRQWGTVFAVLIPVVLWILLNPMGGLPPELVVPLGVGMGACLGHLYCYSFQGLWMEMREHLNSDYRVLHLFPHMNAQARKRASGAMTAMRIALMRGAEVKAVEWAATRMGRRAIDYAASLWFGKSHMA